ncbi:hypothetical protein BN8_01305 [Fibrisoma limi BUZ 3]|uniref:Uncharacterized protein n=1 Tax=Fibrisoma limi BUZ 3 TaxID=1185876 RepID=I2GEJ0_9BACT|nr:hypothetical protein [Fibrisoma limi]CCH52315.1 hypothetical protein BN8_01305 [Fibrisoma limi BUZ 3]
MNPFRRFMLAAGSVLLGTSTQAQQASPTLRDFTEQRMQHQKVIGYTLGSYALANIAVGAIGASQSSGETKYFHRMNVYWNLVNLGIAGAGLLGARRKGAGDETLGQAIRQHENMKQILLLNAGLDVAYIVGGAYLLERAKNRPENRDQLRGFGKSVIGQGGFLLAFDVVNYFIFKKRGDRQAMQLVGAAPMGVGVVLPIK